MTAEILAERDRLFTLLEDEFENTLITVRPRSPRKYNDGTETTIQLRYPDEHEICGVQLQIRMAKVKMWFCDYPEWEYETKYHVKVYAKNGGGAGSGKGFYVENVDDCVNEVKAFVNTYYPETL